MNAAEYKYLAQTAAKEGCQKSWGEKKSCLKQAAFRDMGLLL